MLKYSRLSKIFANINDYFLLLFSLIIIIGSFIYYVDAFYGYDLILAMIAIGTAFVLLNRKLIINNKDFENIKINWFIIDKKSYLYLAAYILTYTFLIIILFLSQSGQALISPWQVVGADFFIGYFILSIILSLSLVSNKLSSGIKIFLISLHYFITLAVALIIYKIGYGFDPFIHQATMELIDKKGLVTPKPPYYLGQYSLIIILHKISGLSIYFLNKILVPFFTAFFLPLALYRFLKSFFVDIKDKELNHNNQARILSIFFILILGVSPFIVTTPQNFSYLFLILTILNGLSREKLFWTILLAIATVAIHPLTGIPALGWVAWLIFKKYQSYFSFRSSKIMKITIFSANALILPVALYFSGGKNIKMITLNASLIIDPFKNILSRISMAGKEDWLFNLIYLFDSNYNLFLILIVLISLVLFFRKKNKPDWSSLLYINISLIIAYILSSQIIFDDLINYEQSGYSNRLLVIICLFNLPFIIWAIEKIIYKILQNDKAIQVIWLIIGLSLLTMSLYISYPRYDKYFNSRGYSVGENDVKAVQLINQESTEPYIVLANQQVSAAALKEFGFNNYYQSKKGLIYFYPIPTGGPLYQYYLDMVYKTPNQENVQGALNLVGVKIAYLIVNKYWNNSGKIINEAKLQSNNWFEINNDVYIFKYKSQN